MSESERGGNLSSEIHRTLRFAAMRENIAECVARVDAQTFGGAAEVTVPSGVRPGGHSG